MLWAWTRQQWRSRLILLSDPGGAGAWCRALTAAACAACCAAPARRIDNPAYKGIWVAPDIPNPDYKHDDKLYLQKDIKYVGFELWQVRPDGGRARQAAPHNTDSSSSTVHAS